ncbi:hypothetical protein BKP37_06225 [Anaerobacillus alkalilacustris]|uniref:Uncharacterized protein n=1 Tax=Anaerobacillus alkalilacustris TaxID=393763 RepID=A0A1S2LVL6_9BACI|nr:hypothetical protein [Anaerobacillus alkalilacustris]OIJ16386.1 hypothetical protein BKP37_06225 [Anaerobacillus alkalilacustris]
MNDAVRSFYHFKVVAWAWEKQGENYSYDNEDGEIEIGPIFSLCVSMLVMDLRFTVPLFSVLISMLICDEEVRYGAILVDAEKLLTSITA